MGVISTEVLRVAPQCEYPGRSPGASWYAQVRTFGSGSGWFRRPLRVPRSAITDYTHGARYSMILLWLSLIRLWLQTSLVTCIPGHRNTPQSDTTRSFALGRAFCQ